jgi:FkbM family methyltransferase
MFSARKASSLAGARDPRSSTSVAQHSSSQLLCYILPVSALADWKAAPPAEKANYFEFMIEKIIEAVCKSGDIAVDAGANWGAHTITMLAAGARVHAFEPNPEMASQLEAWGHEHLTVHRAALSDRQGTATFYFAENAGYGSLRIRPHQPVRVVGSCEVLVCRLDDFGLSPKLIKADVEGEEVNLLKGAWQTLAGARPVVLVELDRRVAGEAAVIALLEQLPEIGYRAFDFFGEPMRVDDWDAWNVLLYSAQTLPAVIQSTLHEAGTEFFRDHRDWDPYQKLSR